MKGLVHMGLRYRGGDDDDDDDEESGLETFLGALPELIVGIVVLVVVYALYQVMQNPVAQQLGDAIGSLAGTATSMLDHWPTFVIGAAIIGIGWLTLGNKAGRDATARMFVGLAKTARYVGVYGYIGLRNMARMSRYTQWRLDVARQSATDTLGDAKFSMLKEGAEKFLESKTLDADGMLKDVFGNTELTDAQKDASVRFVEAARSDVRQTAKFTVQLESATLIDAAKREGGLAKTFETMDPASLFKLGKAGRVLEPAEIAEIIEKTGKEDEQAARFYTTLITNIREEKAVVTSGKKMNALIKNALGQDEVLLKAFEESAVGKKLDDMEFVFPSLSTTLEKMRTWGKSAARIKFSSEQANLLARETEEAARETEEAASRIR